MQTETNKLIGGNGTEFITATAKGKQYTYLVVNEDAVFTTIIGAENTNILTDLKIGEHIIRQGMIIRPRNGELIQTVTLESGSVFGIIN